MEPNTYVVIDTETNHYDNPFVLQMGFCQVENGEVKCKESFNVIPPCDVFITPEAQAVHGLSRQMLEKTGSVATDIIPVIHETLVHFSQGWMMGQNFTFDTKALNLTFQRVGLEPIDFTKIQFIDVGVIFKAYRMIHEWHRSDMYRSKDVSLHAFFDRVRGQRVKGLKWNIDFCMEWFSVDAPKRGDHDAAEDCWLTHLIYQKMVEQGIVKEVLFAR